MQFFLSFFSYLIVVWQTLIRLLFSVKEPEPVLVFEDATSHGYGVSAGHLNYEGAKFVAGKLAKFHAASLYLERDVSSID